MYKDAEQPQSKKTARSKTNEPRPLSIPSDRLRDTSPRPTEGGIDQGLDDPSRTSSSIRRYNNLYNTDYPRGGPPSGSMKRTRDATPNDDDEYNIYDDYVDDNSPGSRRSDIYDGGHQSSPRTTGGYNSNGRPGGPRSTDRNTMMQNSSGRQTNAHPTGRPTQTPRKGSSTSSRDLTRTPNKTRDYSQRTGTIKPAPPPRRVHWFLPVGIGMLAMLLLWLLGANVVAWGTQIYNDVHYGTPRTYQVNAVAGHNHDSAAHPSHFIALNLNRQAIIIEMMASDPQKAITYVVPGTIAGDGGDRVPITLEFRDVTNDHKLDMIVHIHLPSQDQVSVFINDGTKFRPSTSSDKLFL